MLPPIREQPPKMPILNRVKTYNLEKFKCINIGNRDQIIGITTYIHFFRACMG